MVNIQSILQQHWGYHSFRPLQEEIINTVLSGKDCLALLPTGGGKSICFQVPAMAKPGLCLVISPLIALMKDQVENLRKKNITAFAIYSGMTRKEVIATLNVAGHSNCKFLYVSPERLETGLFKEFLPSLNINLIAVDEAHCISQWGYDFRPPYLKISSVREELPGIPVLALTASATEEVQRDICEKLSFTESRTFRQSFSRPNLSYSAFAVPSKINKIIEILEKVKGTGLVYCKSRRRTREIADLLKMHGISADHYHAGLSQEQRSIRQEAWIKNDTRIIVCTNAFGMGIDKPEVRAVIHADVPDCLENYYQEAGRAGRDGKKSYAVLLYTDLELQELKSSVQLRFPGIDIIRKIYNDLMNHLQVPAGAGEGLSFDFDISLFVKQFGLDSLQTFSVIKTLEQEQLLYFNEQVFNPSKVQVTASRRTLSELETVNPPVDAVLKTLLRTYEGILDQPTGIQEKTIAWRLKKEPSEMTPLLGRLAAMGLIEYFPQKDKPQVFLIHDRIKASDLTIDRARYKQRKQLFETRITKMIGYSLATDICRSVIIGNYFGDSSIEDCGICDICLKKTGTPLNEMEWREVYEKISSVPLSFNDIVVSTPRLPRSKILAAIKFLQSENKLVVSSSGLISRPDADKR